MQFVTYNGSAWGSRMTLDNTGNVGIGTSSPTNFSNGTVVEAAGGSNTGAFLASSNSGTVVAEMQGNNADGLTYFGSRTNHPVVLRQNGSERMRIDSSGNVGIGTNSPSSYYANQLVLGVGGEGGLTIAGPTNGENYIMFADGTSGVDRYRGYIGYNHATNTLRFGTSGNENMRIDSGGSVAIGLSSAGTKLDVGGTIRSVVSGGTPILYLNNGTTQHSIQNTSGAFTFFNNGSERMRIDSSGNVLVGKTADNFGTIGTAINQVGEVQITRASATPMYIRRNTNNGELIGFYKDNTAVGSIAVSASDNLSIYANAANHAGINFITSAIIPMSGGSETTSVISLGDSNRKFKDGHFSGSLYGDGSNLTGVGGSTTAGAVGTYSWLYHNNNTLTNGSTVSGSTLRDHNGNDNAAQHNHWSSSSVVYNYGTWRNMAGDSGYANTTYGSPSLFVRIS
jgi:hypothetical protein